MTKLVASLVGLADGVAPADEQAAARTATATSPRLRLIGTPITFLLLSTTVAGILLRDGTDEAVRPAAINLEKRD